MTTLQLTDHELQAIIDLMDLAVKSAGIRVATNAAIMLAKFEKAKRDSLADENRPNTPESAN